MPAHGPCPSCSGQLVQIERSGVRIDACRQCRGVWLDRGELDQILERERSYIQHTRDEDEEFFREMSGSQQRQQSYGFDKKTAEKLLGDFRTHKQHKHKSHKKKSFLDELFD